MIRPVNLGQSAVAQALKTELCAFMRDRVLPSEPVYEAQARELDPHAPVPVMRELKEEARERGLWNLFLPEENEWTPGLGNLDYAPLAEVSGRSPFLAPQVLNCSAPDTGNMELLAGFGTDEQKERWLTPLLRGEMRSCFMMTEPDAASSDATSIACIIDVTSDEVVVNGRKWWISGAADPDCRVAIVMGKSDPNASPYRQQSMVLVPMDTPGVSVIRDLSVFGYNDREGHCEVVLQDVHVPRANLIGDEGGGFAMAQARLGPGRLHHCMRSIGTAERALELMCRRTQSRAPFGRPLSDQGVVRQWVADSRIDIDQARLMTLRAAWALDRFGNREARGQLAAIKVLVPAVATRVIDRAIQAHGGAGVSQDLPLAQMYANQRALRIADGPDEVHRETVARVEFAKYG
jgi:acyl-CoA dehydrogenase